MKKFLLLTIVSTTLVLSCKKSSNSGGGTTTTNCPTVAPKFSADASPVIASKCATNSGCHASGAINSGGPLTSYTQINAKKANIRASVANGSMPQGSSLSAAEKQAIICWIDAGAAND